MILLADSGSTNTDWALLDEKKSPSFFKTSGMNPFFQDENSVSELIRKEFSSDFSFSEISEIHFYGAGCSDEKRCTVISNGLKHVFLNAEIHVEHDLLAAARATCIDHPGIACILGTGSNSCLYDGKSIVDNIPALGYVLGDEGSASYFGKELLRRYLYREFPEELAETFTSAFPSSKEAILENIYHQDDPNTYIANFSLFLSLTKKHPYINQLITEGFDVFFDRHVKKYADYPSYKIHFVGAIAFHFTDILKAAASKNNLTVGKVIGKPIDDLVTYHLRDQES